VRFHFGFHSITKMSIYYLPPGGLANEASYTPAADDGQPHLLPAAAAPVLGGALRRGWGWKWPFHRLFVVHTSSPADAAVHGALQQQLGSTPGRERGVVQR
jgi:hypothetical protein